MDIGSLFAAATTNPPASATTALWQADTLVKVIAGTLGIVGTLLGLPVAFLQFRKTRAEIRKLELEATSLQQKTSATSAVSVGHRIVIDGDRNVVQILADPRFLGPLLLLLDFIFASVVIALSWFAAEVFLERPWSLALVGLLAAVLLIPIAREARRVKRVLTPERSRSGSKNAEPGAALNGGPATPVGNSGVTEGPPSVS